MDNEHTQVVDAAFAPTCPHVHLRSRIQARSHAHTNTQDQQANDAAHELESLQAYQTKGDALWVAQTI